jgi:hypothetical protein
MAIVSLDSPSCEVPCLILHSVEYRDVTRQAKGLHCLKYVEALERGLAHLSRCNSDWFCHTDPPNFPFLHPSIVPRSAGELELRHRSASPLTRRHTAPQPQPRVLAALHHPAEVIRLLLHYLPTPQPAKRRAAIAAGENPSHLTIDDPFPPHLLPNQVRE